MSKGESETLLVDPGETARRLKALLYTSNRSVSVIFRLPGRAALLAVAQPSAEEGDSWTERRQYVSGQMPQHEWESEECSHPYPFRDDRVDAEQDRATPKLASPFLLCCSRRPCPLQPHCR